MGVSLVPHPLATETEHPPLQNGITEPLAGSLGASPEPPLPSMQLPGCMVSNHTQAVSTGFASLHPSVKRSDSRLPRTILAGPTTQQALFTALGGT